MKERTKGGYIELNVLSDALASIMALCESHNFRVRHMPGEGPDKSFLVFDGKLPDELRSELADNPGVAYIWDDDGTRAFVEVMGALYGE